MRIRHGSARMLLACGLSACTVAIAQSSAAYPARAVRFIVPFTPGGGTDIVARSIAQRLSEFWGQQVLVDNRPGGGTTIGIDVAAKSAPDGYTFVLGGASFSINAAWGRKLPYDPDKDLGFVTQTSMQPYVVSLHPSLPARNVKELVALAKAKPGSLNFASPGPGTGSHLSVELFKLLTATQVVHIPYKGSSPALNDLIGGQTHFMFATILSVAAHIKSGRLRALATTGSARSTSLRDLPTVAEAGVPGYEANSWNGIMVPAATPAEIRDKIQRDVARALKTADVRSRFEADGAEPVSSTPAEFAALVRRETIKWGKVIKAAGILPSES